LRFQTIIVRRLKEVLSPLVRPHDSYGSVMRFLMNLGKSMDRSDDGGVVDETKSLLVGGFGSLWARGSNDWSQGWAVWNVESDLCGFLLASVSKLAMPDATSTSASGTWRF
jgi:hypothetical protein